MLLFKVVMAAHLMIDVEKNICIVDLQEVSKVEKREQPHQSLQKCSIDLTSKIAYVTIFKLTTFHIQE